MKICSVEAELYLVDRTEMTKLVFAFHTFVTPLKSI